MRIVRQSFSLEGCKVEQWMKVLSGFQEKRTRKESDSGNKG